MKILTRLMIVLVLLVSYPRPAHAMLSEAMQYACMYYYNGIPSLGGAHNFASISPEVDGRWWMVENWFAANLTEFFPNFNELSVEGQQDAIYFTWGETFYHTACNPPT